MALPTTYNTKCPLFDRPYRGSGVMFPYFPSMLGQNGGNVVYINLDATAGCTSTAARVRFPMTVMVVTCEAWAVSDDQGLKTAAASVEPVVAITYGTYPLGSAGAGTEIASITCNASGPIGKKWTDTTTEITLKPTQELIIYLKTAAGKGSGASGTVDGGAVPVLWLAQLNAP